MFDNVADLDFNAYHINELLLALTYSKRDCSTFFFTEFRANIPIGTIYAHFVADLCLYSKEGEFV